jgi:outer membrane protein TolC
MKNLSIKINRNAVAFLLLWMSSWLIPEAKAQTNDSLPAYAQGHELYPLNLETVLKLAGANNLTIEEFSLRQELAQERQRTAQEWLYPEIFAGLNLDGRTGTAMNADGRFFRDIERNRLWGGAGLELSWNPGQAVYQVLAAKQELQASKHLLQAERNQAILQAVQAFLDLENAQLRYDAQSRLLDYSSRIARQLEVQVESGLQYRSELLLAKSNYNSQQVALRQARQNIYLRAARLAELLALPDEDILLLSEAPVTAPLGFFEMNGSADELYQAAYTGRPELAYQSRQADALQQQRRQFSTGLLMPSLEFRITNGALGPFRGMPRNNGETFGDGRYENTLDAALYLGWNLPLAQLFSGGQRRQLDTQLKLQENRYQQQKNQVQREVRQARHNLEESRRQFELAEEGARFAEQALEQSTERQKLGTARPFEVFQAQETYIRAMLSYLDVVNAYNKAQYSLYVATGNNL